jgi:AcrR family transcriptional regulator
MISSGSERTHDRAEEAEATGEPAPGRRRYDSPTRRQRAAETLERIVAAGSELIHEGPLWDWSALTFAAVAARARVNERTVYRYFPAERDLHTAVLERLEEESDIDLDGMSLEGVAGVAVRSFVFAASFPLRARTERSPSNLDADRNRCEALIRAVAPLTGDWSEPDRQSAAAVLDLLWSLTSYERLVTTWEMDARQTTRTITWAIGLIEAAIREGRGPDGLNP